MQCIYFVSLFVLSYVYVPPCLNYVSLSYIIFLLPLNNSRGLIVDTPLIMLFMEAVILLRLVRVCSIRLFLLARKRPSV